MLLFVSGLGKEGGTSDHEIRTSVFPLAEGLPKAASFKFPHTT